MSLDYSLDGGVTWTTAPSGNVQLNTVNNTFVLTVPAGTSANIYTPGQVRVRDTFAQSVNAACGRWVVSSFNPVTVGSGTLIFGFEAANPICVAFDSLGNVNRINDLSGSGRYLTIGPTAVPSPSTFPPPLIVPAGAGVLGGAPVGPLAPYLRLSGSDGTRSLVGFTPFPNSNDGLWNTNANFFDAGPLGGPNDALIQLWNTSNMTTGAETVVFSLYLDVTVAAQYGGGPIWGRWPTTSTVSYITACRWHSGTFAAQWNDNPSGMFLTNGQAASTSGWRVCTLQRNGTLFQFRINKGSWVTNTVTSSAAYSSTNFYWGGSVAPSLNQSTGNAYPIMGDFYIYSGALNSTDLGNVETTVGNSIGLII